MVSFDENTFPILVCAGKCGGKEGLFPDARSFSGVSCCRLAEEPMDPKPLEHRGPSFRQFPGHPQEGFMVELST